MVHLAELHCRKSNKLQTKDIPTFITEVITYIIKSLISVYTYPNKISTQTLDESTFP